jgi:penicillin amidase
VYLGSNWFAPWRAIRINRLLRADSAVTPDDMRRFQTDPSSPRAEAFLPYFLAAADRIERTSKPDPEVRLAADILRAWDRRYTVENRAAGLFELAMQALAARTWNALAGPTPGSAVLFQLLHFPQSPWWDDHRTARVEDRDDRLVASLREAMVKGTARFGPPGSDGWRWGRIQHANLYHLLQIPAFSALGIPAQGGPSTLSPSSGDGTEGASWRMVVELGPEVHAWGTYPGGQSGNPASPRYDDRLTTWREGRLDSLRFPHRPGDLLSSDVSSVLILRPAS